MRRASGYTRMGGASETLPSREPSNLDTNIYVTMQGKEFAGWIDLDDPLLPARTNGRNSGDLNESCAYIIESLFRDECSLSYPQMDLDSFDAVGATSGSRPSEDWKFARCLNEQEALSGVIGSLCAESNIVSLRDTRNREKVVAIDYNSPTLTITSNDIDTMPGGKPKIRVRQSHIKNIRNEFYLNYRYNYGTGNYDKQMFITADDTNVSDSSRDNTDGFGATYVGLCDYSQTKYGKTERWTFDAQWIRDEATAELFIKSCADWLATRKWEVSATLIYSENTLKLELMDQVFINHELLPDDVDSTNAFFITRLVDGGMSDKFRIQCEFLMLPTVFGFGDGSGYGSEYGNNYGGNL